MCDVSYQTLKGSKRYVKSKSQEPKSVRNFLRLVCAVSAVSIITISLAATAFVLYRHLSYNYNKVPYDLMKSLLRSNIYADHRITESTKNKVEVVKDASAYEPPRIVSCYYNTPRQYDSDQLLPANIHPYLCTHINVAFARIVNKEITLDSIQYKALKDIVKLKKVNPNLKIIVSVGGAGNDGGFSDMVVNHASRKTFIRSIKSLLRNYNLDGIDLDWEFPAIHLQGNQVIDKRERQHFSQLLREIRSEYIREKRNYILTVAVAAPETIIDAAYDVDQLNLYTDFVNIMSYDFHSYTKYTPFTGLNSPLYPRSNEQLYLATLNINYTVHTYLTKGLERNKIVVGIPTYGHTFTLVNPDNTLIGSPASGFGSLGSTGFVNYPDICLFVNRHDNIVIKQDTDAKVPYLYRGREWVSYDSPASVALKADYIKRLGLGGAMIYSLNADDFGGVCHRERGAELRFPLLRSVTNTLLGNDTSTA
jgi:chitinase